VKTAATSRFKILRQGGLFIAYSQSLDIATTGKSEADARARFQTVLDICTRDGVPKAEVCSKLLELGWTQKSKRWAPPEKK